MSLSDRISDKFCNPHVRHFRKKQYLTCLGAEHVAERGGGQQAGRVGEVVHATESQLRRDHVTGVQYITGMGKVVCMSELKSDELCSGVERTYIA